MRYLRPFMAVLIFATAFSVEPVFGGPLEEVAASRVMRKVKRDTKSARRARRAHQDENKMWLHGLDADSNIAQLFSSDVGSEALLNWIGINNGHFKVEAQKFGRTEEVAVANAVLKRNREEIRLRIMVPHPNYEIMAELKTLISLRQFEPPTLKIEDSEEMEFNGIKAMFYRSTKEECSILIKLPKQTIVSLRAAKCEFTGAMIHAAKVLDLDRLSKKLQT